MRPATIASFILFAAMARLDGQNQGVLFPCQIVDLRLSGTGIELACRQRPSANQDFPVNLNQLDDKGNPILPAVVARLALRNNAAWSPLILDNSASPLTLGKNFRITTLDSYTIDGQTKPYVVQTYNFSYPPKVGSPCIPKDYRILAATTAAVRCDVPLPLGFAPTMRLFVLDDNGDETNPQDVTFVMRSDDPQWAIVTLSTGALSNGSYRLRSIPKPPSPGDATQFQSFQYDFDVNKKLSVAVPFTAQGAQPLVDPQTGRTRYIASSKVALDPASFPKATFSEDVLPVRNRLDAKFLPAPSANDLDNVGVVAIWVAPPGLKSLNTHVTITGLTNVLGAQVSIGDSDRLKLPGAPKGKDDATLYAKFLSQAGPGAKPGWAADIKFAPALFPLGGGFFFNPNFTANIGWGTVADTMVADLIHIGVGATKAIPIPAWRSWLPAIQITPQMAFETDREGHHQNLLFDGDTQFFGKGWLHSVKDRNARLLASLTKPGQTPPDIADIQKRFGFLFQAFLGTEIGAALSADTVKSSDKSSSVVLPTYDIARLRPKIAATGELKWLSLTISVTPRYLFTSEAVTRENMVPSVSDPAKQTAQISVSHAKGFRPYGEAGVAIQLDRDGHISLSTTYKLGSLPPNFNKVNTVQTGLQIAY